MSPEEVQTIYLEDGTFYYYNMRPYSLSNVLEAKVAELTEYSFSINPTFSEAIYKLYKTKEGNWYEVNDRNILLNTKIIHELKKAVDADVKHLI